ncbi:MAG: exo-beta-1,3-glucanase [Pseudomonadota bacterium]
MISFDMLNHNWQKVLIASTIAYSLLIPFSACGAQKDISVPPFFSYLMGSGVTPSLIAFNPSGFDPRQPFEVNETSLAELRKDLRIIKVAFNGLILYEMLPGLTAAILATAQELGFKAVLLGIWDPKSEREIADTAELIRQYHVKLSLAVVIGNEGLIDNRYTIEDVQQAALRLQTLIPADASIPVTSSEPVSEYGWKPLREFGEFLAPNIHPAIDQESLDPVAGAEWVKKRANALAVAAKKPVLVKETGVPNGGALSYTPETQRLFWEAYFRNGRLVRVNTVNTWISLAASFEAFDTPWKAEKTEMLIEGHWGFLDIKRNPYPVFEALRNANTWAPK